MADVFISYHEKSAGVLVAQIANALESAGISCWYAKRDIPPGGDFARYIPPQIDACKVFLLILNDNVVHQSNHIENEVGLAFGRLNDGEEITIIPLEIGDFKRETWIRYYLVHMQSVKIPLLNEAYLKELKNKVAYMLGKPSATPVIRKNPEIFIPKIQIIIQCEAGIVWAPVPGKVIPHTEIPDPTFAAGVLGTGVGIWPEEDIIRSPYDGVVSDSGVWHLSNMQHAQHALFIIGSGNMEVLIHIGIDTATMNGYGFQRLVKDNERVKEGEPLIKFDREKIKRAGHPDVVCVLLTNSDDYNQVTFPALDP